MSKDNFSKQADIYVKYRPQYPEELFKFIYELTNHRHLALDVATGNGQAALHLAEYFDKVEAIDSSEKQIANATLKSNLHYSIQKAEKTNFDDHSFDLITVAQALHWFNFDLFFTEIDRLLKPNAVFCAWCYGLNSVNQEVDRIVLHFYESIVGPFWDKERKHIELKYNSIPFPWTMKSKDFNYTTLYSANDFIGYLNTWSSVQHYIKQEGINPVDLIKNDLMAAWGEKELPVNFPIHLKWIKAR